MQLAICLLAFDVGAAGVTLLCDPLAAPISGVAIERTGAFHTCLEFSDHPILVTGTATSLFVSRNPYSR
jgi:hypothetical protein